MWAEAAKAIKKYPEGVLNAVDAEGYPVSVRQTSLSYDAATGTLPVALPESLGAQEGPATVLCHFHDENLWGLHAILLKGRLERRDGTWVFVTKSFAAPSAWQFMTNTRKAAKAYLESRGLPVPKVNFTAIDEMWRTVKASQKR